MKLPRPSWFEVVAILATAASCAYYLSWWGVTWQSVLAIVMLLILGYMAGNMILNLWGVPAKKRQKPPPP
jgi:predicted Na+-dependent transporter